MRRVVASVSLTVIALAGPSGIAQAEQPGPGSKQCTPGQQGNPHPGHKAGACKKK